MHCQELYHDDQRCPHMIQVRLKREKREALSSPSMRQSKDGGQDPLNRSSPTRARWSERPRGAEHGRRPDHRFMSEKEAHDGHRKTRTNGLSRRQVLGTTAAAGAAGAAGVAGGVALTDTGVITPAEAQTRPAAPGGAARRRQQVRGQAGRARRVLRVLLQRPDRRGPHHRPAVDARADAHPGVQPRQRHRLGPDQREPQDPDRGADAARTASS